MRCPRKYYLRYIRKLRGKPSIHLIRGSAVHTALERFFSEGYASDRCTHYDDTRNAILDVFKNVWSERMGELQDLELEAQDLEFYYSDSQKMLINFLHDFLKTEVSDDGTSELEKMLFSKKWLLMGRIDRRKPWTDPSQVIDYKTTKSAELTDEVMRQAGCYKLLAEDRFNRPADVYMHFLRFVDGKKKIPLTEDYMAELKDTIIELHHKTLSEDEKDYPCTCGGWCEKEFKP